MTKTARDGKREKLAKIAREHGDVLAIYRSNGDNIDNYYFIAGLNHRSLIEYLSEFNARFFLRGENIKLLAVQDKPHIDYNQFGELYWKPRSNGQIS